MLDIRFKMEIPNSIEDVCEKGTVEIDSESVRVENVGQGCIVNIYSIDGRVVMSAKADGNGLAIIPLHAISAGIYILNYNDITIKFIRR